MFDVTRDSFAYALKCVDVCRLASVVGGGDMPTPTAAAERLGVTLRRAPLDGRRACATDGRLLLYRPDPDLRVEGARIWQGLGTALLMRLGSDWGTERAVVAGACLAAPPVAVRRLCMHRLVEVQATLPAWLLLAWASFLQM